MSLPRLTTPLPIMVAQMNQINNLPFTIACARTGMLANIWPYTTGLGNEFYTNKAMIERALGQFTEAMGHGQVSLSVYTKDYVNILDLIDKYSIEYVELLGSRKHYEIQELDLTQLGAAKLILRHTLVQEPCSDFALVKGSESAGTPAVMPLEEMYQHTLELNRHNRGIIVMGGIDSAEKVKHWINQGASGVAIGTLLALSEESPIDPAVKQAMITSLRPYLTRIEGTQQQAIQWGLLPLNKTDWNRTKHLKASLSQLREKAGMIYASSSIHVIEAIEPLEVILHRLASLLG